MAKKPKKAVPPGYKLVFRAWKTDRNGRRLNASHYGLRAWPLVVPISK